MSTTASPRPVNGIAIAAFVLSFLICWLGVILGFVAMSSIRASGERGSGLARAAVIIGFVEIGLVILGFVAFGAIDAGPK